MKYFVFQGNDHDCGFAALKMLLANLAKDKSYLYIPKPAKRENYDLYELVQLSKSYGVELEVNGCTRDYFDYLKADSLTMIDESHVVMVKKRKKKSLILYDPGRGIIKMRKDEFLRRWRCIVIEPNGSENIVKIDKIRQQIIPTRLNIASSLISLFSAALLIAAFYLLNKIENFAYSLIFLSLFVTAQIAEKFILYKQVHSFDKEFIPLYFKNKKNCSKEKYAEYNDYKRKFFTYNRQILSSVLLAFTVTFLLCFNDFRNVFAILALILIKLLEIIVFSKPDQDIKNRISELENHSFKDLDTTRDLAFEACTKADQHLFIDGAKEIFYIFAAFIFALGMMFVTQNTGSNFLIFHFVMYYVSFISYSQLINNLSFRKENAQMERRFFDSCNL